MADGGGSGFIFRGRIIEGRDADQLTLSSALGLGHIVGRCPRCEHRESADTSFWERSTIERGYHLLTLGRRLRCLCGSKTVELEVWPVACRAHQERRRIYHWRA